jgi:uncharacterized protein with PQ loop repeat
MVNRTKGLHHYHIRKRMYQKYEPYPSPVKINKIYDKIIYIVVIIGPIMNLPQLFRIWITKNATGVSFVSWMGFSIISVVWLGYGILHRDKPILLMNFALMIIQALIAIGTFIYG